MSAITELIIVDGPDDQTKVIEVQLNPSSGIKGQLCKVWQVKLELCWQVFTQLKKEKRFDEAQLSLVSNTHRKKTKSLESASAIHLLTQAQAKIPKYLIR